MRFVTDPKQAREVVMRDGSKYPVGVGGSFVITDSRHLDEMAKGNHDVYSSAVTFRGTGWDCLCGHSCWPWSDTCGRCGQSRRDVS